jgi:predicted nicotinamide N-methyase
MQWQTSRFSLPIGHKIFDLDCLTNLEHTIDRLFEKLEAEGRPELLEELCPYFGVIWPSARGLTEYLERNQFRKGIKTPSHAIELGCGLAVPSLLVASKGCPVLATDMHPEVPSFLARNAALNHVAYRDIASPEQWTRSSGILSYCHYDWRNLDRIPEMSVPLVIASDVLYEKEQPFQLARLFDRLIAPGGQGLLSDPGRPYIQQFSDEITKLGRQVETKAHGDIFILEIR